MIIAQVSHHVTLEINIRNEWEHLSGLFARVVRAGYLFAGVFVSAADALLFSRAPPGTSESSPSDKRCHSWSPETVNREPGKSIDEVSLKEQTHPAVLLLTSGKHYHKCLNSLEMSTGTKMLYNRDY